MSMRVLLSGLSPFICIRRSNLARIWRNLGETPSRLLSSTTLSGSTSSRSIGRTRSVQQSPLVYEKRIAWPLKFSSQAGVAEEPTGTETSTNTTSEATLPQNLEKLNVKELKDLLASRSLKTSGIKSELIQRLQSASQGNVQSQPVQGMSDASPEPMVDGQETSSTWSKMTVKELKLQLAELGLSTSGLKNELAERLQSALTQASQPTSPGVLHPERPIEELAIQQLQDFDSSAPLQPLAVSEGLPVKESTESLDSLTVPSIPQPLTPPEPPISIEAFVQPFVSERVPDSEPSTAGANGIVSSISQTATVVDSSSSTEPALEPQLASENVVTPELSETENASMVAFISQPPTTPTEPVTSIKIPLDDIQPDPGPQIVSKDNASHDDAETKTGRTMPAVPQPSIPVGSITSIDVPLLPDLSETLSTPEFYKKRSKYKKPIFRKSERHARVPETPEDIHDDLARSAITLYLFQNRVRNFRKDIETDVILARGTHFANAPMLMKTKPLREDDGLERTMSLARLYFSKTFRTGLRNGPQTTRGIRIADFKRPQEAELLEIYLNTIISRSKGEKQSKAADFEAAWNKALEKFSRLPKNPFVGPPIQAAGIMNRKGELEVPPRTIGSDMSTQKSHGRTFTEPIFGPKHASEARNSKHPPALPTRSTNSGKSTKQSENPTLAGPLKQTSAIANSKVHLTVAPTATGSNISKQNSQDRTGFTNLDQDPPGREFKATVITDASKRSAIEHLAASPVTLSLSISQEQKRAFLTLPDPQHTIGAFTTDGDPLCQIYNSMWVRLGLMDHIESIRKDKSKDEYKVTFKSFDAAAAFVNRVDQHWLHDPVTGQVYATWDTPKGNQTKLTALIVLPRATLEVWRGEALKAGIPISEYHGFPLVEWSKSMWAVLCRMGFTVGKEGDCMRYRTLWERKQRAIIEMVFRGPSILEDFLARKQDHYLTNPWKDRFFAKHHVKLGSKTNFGF